MKRPLLRKTKLSCFNLYNYTVSNSVSLRTISKTKTGNYTAWTRLTSSVTADGSLLRAVSCELPTCRWCLNIKGIFKIAGIFYFVYLPLSLQAIKWWVQLGMKWLCYNDCKTGAARALRNRGPLEEHQVRTNATNESGPVLKTLISD